LRSSVNKRSFEWLTTLGWVLQLKLFNTLMALLSPLWPPL
jgi:hypothetical protein